MHRVADATSEDRRATSAVVSDDPIPLLSVTTDADAASWSANAAAGSLAVVSADRVATPAALRFDFDLVGHGAWAIARRDVDVVLPPRYVIRLRLRGETPRLELQLKLVDPTGASVWWWRRRDFAVGAPADELVFRRASLALAWGPTVSRFPERIGAVEIAVAADVDTRGALWIEELAIEPRPAVTGAPRVVTARASSAVADHEAARAIDGDGATSWRPDPSDAHPSLELDLGERREWGGVVIAVAAGSMPAIRVSASDDGARWTPLADQPAEPATRVWIRTGEAESRWIRLELGTSATAIANVGVVPIELAVSPARYAAEVARAAPRGRFPRHLLEEQAYWAVVGADADERKGLLGEDGAIEVAAEAFTLEPFLRVDGRLVTWADVATTAALADDGLPLPSVTWTHDAVSLRVAPFVVGSAGASTLVARYELTTDGGTDRDVRLLVAIRPFQVTPAWQSLNLVGGVAPITRLERAGAHVRVNGEREVVAVTRPDGFRAVDSTDGMTALFDDARPAADVAGDPVGFAQGAFAFDVRIARGAPAVVAVAVPLFAASPSVPAGLAPADAAEWSGAQHDAVTSWWHARLASIPIALPPAAIAYDATLRASLGWILVDREGPRIQAGPRTYRRSWIRDGTFTATALAEMGYADEARAFVRWYAPYQLPDGRVPCAVDRRGIDHAVEHDSHGQLVWGVVELFRLTGDREFLGALWPHVVRAVDAIGALRAERLDETDRVRCRYGLLPESISHEGYAASPVHSYWDDLFALRGLADAAYAAGVLGDAATATRAAALRDAMRGDLATSIACTMERHRLDVIPGSVELGDFDPTSTAAAFDPCGEAERLPCAALERTFARYWEEFEARRHGTVARPAYSAYEMRNVVALLRLGWKERALALLAWLVEDQRPTAWREWPEISHRDRRAPAFLGDLPHGWIASTYLRTLRRLIADERDDGTLVLLAGVPEAWVRDPPGVRVRAMRMTHGVLDLTACVEGDALRVAFGACPSPPAGVVLEFPLARDLHEIIVDGTGRAVEDPRRVRLATAPRDLVLR